MAQALRVFIKFFCKHFTQISEYEVFKTYDPSIRSKEAASRQYRIEPEAVLRHAMESNDKIGAHYESFAELVRSKTRDGREAVARALEVDARRVSEELEQCSQLFDEIDLWNHLKCEFLRDEAFRRDFNRALQDDGLMQNCAALWGYVDEKMEALNGALADDIETVMEAQCAALTACVYASLTGSIAIRQDMGEPLDQTPIMRSSPTDTRKQSTDQNTTAQLQGIEFFGSDIASWSTHTEDTRESGTLFAPLYRFAAEQGARIGRDDHVWCAADGHIPVVTSADYVSRHQCEIFYENGQWFITDVGPDGAGSKNGTLVTSADPNTPPKILSGETCPLKHGDLICINPNKIVPREYGADNYTWRTNEAGENFRFELVPKMTRVHKSLKA